MAAANLMARRGRLPPPPPLVAAAAGVAPPLSAFLLLVVLFLLLLGLGPGPVSGLGSCRCLPHSDCWPSPDTWRQLNVSIGGHLLAPTPPALPCHSGSTATSTAACRATIQNWNNPFWRADQPGAMQYTNREAYGNQSCFLSNPNSTSPPCDASAISATSAAVTISSSERGCFCFQGAVPPYAVEAVDATHVQAAIRFAAVHNLRLSIISIGHDIVGRRIAPCSLNI